MENRKSISQVILEIQTVLNHTKFKSGHNLESWNRGSILWGWEIPGQEEKIVLFNYKSQLQLEIRISLSGFVQAHSMIIPGDTLGLDSAMEFLWANLDYAGYLGHFFEAEPEPEKQYLPAPPAQIFVNL